MYKIIIIAILLNVSIYYFLLNTLIKYNTNNINIIEILF